MTAVSAECKVPQFHLKLIFGSTKTGLVVVKRLPGEECGAFEILIPPNIQIRPYHQVRIPDNFRKGKSGFFDLNCSERRRNSSSLMVSFSKLKRSNSLISLNEVIFVDRSLLKTTFSTQTPFGYSRRRRQTRRGCLRSLFRMSRLFLFILGLFFEAGNNGNLHGITL